MLAKLKNDEEQMQAREKDYAEEDHHYEQDLKLEAEMSKRKITKLTREYEMLSFTFSAAAILFKDI